MKSYLLIIFALLPLKFMAQDCSLKDEKDRYNQDPRLTTGFKSMGAGNNKFLISISADKKEVDVFIALNNSTICFNDYSKAMITFDNKQRGTYKNGGTTNCKGYFHFIFPNQENLNANLLNLSLKTIASIQFSDENNKKDILTVRAEDAAEILKMTNCVLSELPNLRLDTWKPKL